ncbi:hypothetical protein E1A91_D03G096400v1 [Gossypium mustelinum]|uniref:Uncharacterized protein n=2 Tax=Gossypium TaxID=3633 RepID=A0A5D2VL94_GOSMU|nr:hypothetical protein ES332_D03G106800v1 [Gossypium tomentosum]TYI90045.1 hypothetical protein E1A91_D03G096400v1 [Gossypium mustelinum]
MSNFPSFSLWLWFLFFSGFSVVGITIMASGLAKFEISGLSKSCVIDFNTSRMLRSVNYFVY